MTAFKRAQAAGYGADRTIVASAQRIDIHNKVESDRMRQRSAAAAVWQKEAWIYYDGIGEIKFAYSLIAAVASRIRLYVGVVVDPGSPPVPVDNALETKDDVDTGSNADDASKARRDLVVDEDLVRMGGTEFKKQMSHSSIPQIMRGLVPNLCVPGESYLVLEDDKWTARSTSEVKIAVGDGKYQVQRSRSEAAGIRFLKDGSTVGRVWREHPEYSMDPDSAMLGLRADCEELMLLSRVVRTIARAALNAGFLYVPDEVSVVSRTNPDNGSEESEAEGDPLETELLYTMTEPIGNENSATGVVPMLLRGPAEYADKVVHIPIVRKSDEFLMARADRVLERILQGLDVPKDIVTGLANVKYPVSVDHEMLTRSGWRRYDEVEVGEDIYTLNHGTGLAEWQPLIAVHVHDHDGPMLRMKSRTHSSLSTPEHGWPVYKTGRKVSGSRRRWTTSGEGFAATDRVFVAADAADLPVEPKYSDDFVRLVALYTSDGTLASGGPQIRKFRPAQIEKTRSVFTRVFGAAEPGVWSEYPAEGGASFRVSRGAASALLAAAPGLGKVVTRQFVLDLTQAQLEVFLHAFVELGDGHDVVTQRGGTMRFHQTEKARLDAIELAGVLSGRTPRWLKSIPEKTNAWGGVSQECHVLTLSSSRWFQPRSRSGVNEWEHYTGKVFCPETATHTWLARHKGRVFYTANSNAIQIDESMYKAHVEPLALMICDAVTDIILHPSMRVRLTAEGKDPTTDLSQIVVWYDPSEVVTRPNRSADATTGYNNYILSGAAWRDAHGFAVTDAPDEEEIAFRLAMEKAVIPEEMAIALFKALLPTLTKAARTANTEGESAIPEDLVKMLESGKPPEAPLAEGSSVGEQPDIPDAPDQPDAAEESAT